MTPNDPTSVFTRIVEQRYDECRRAAITTFPAATPVITPDGIRLHVALRLGRWRRAVPMRLEVAPWTTDGGLAGIELIPLRRVRPSRRYLASGHRLLDDLIAAVSAMPRRAHACVPARGSTSGRPASDHFGIASTTTRR